MIAFDDGTSTIGPDYVLPHTDWTQGTVQLTGHTTLTYNRIPESPPSEPVDIDPDTARRARARELSGAAIPFVLLEPEPSPLVETLPAAVPRRITRECGLGTRNFRRAA